MADDLALACAATPVDHPVAGDHGAVGAGHPLPPPAGFVDRRGLAPHLTFDDDHGVAADHHVIALTQRRGDRFGLAPGQRDDGKLGRQIVDRGLVDTAHDHIRIEAGLAQQPQPGG